MRSSNLSTACPSVCRTIPPLLAASMPGNSTSTYVVVFYRCCISWRSWEFHHWPDPATTSVVFYTLLLILLVPSQNVSFIIPTPLIAPVQGGLWEDQGQEPHPSRHAWHRVWSRRPEECQRDQLPQAPAPMGLPAWHAGVRTGPQGQRAAQWRELPSPRA